ncbi:hypothetical protein [Sphingobacterium sp. LRF_L2]|uniref:hypothetical protein n=1 Tax=Sphingobacterium sp. LRF_L2 TaxID=3369421 RepID=UPI003F5DD2D2
MNVSKELILKYHLGECTAQEKALVEEWLFSDEGNTDTILPLDADQKENLKTEIWTAIKEETILQEVIPRIPKKERAQRIIFISKVAVACLLVIAGAWLGYRQYTPRIQFEGQFDQTLTPVETQQDISLVLGEGSRATFDDKQELLDFCGIVKLKANKRMKLFLATGCEDGSKNTRTLLVDAGETYFALDLSNKNDADFFVMREDHLNELPPLILNSIRAQFGI